MDKYIIERRARMRLAWFKRYEEIGNISKWSEPLKLDTLD